LSLRRGARQNERSIGPSHGVVEWL
jgi:hypothetical protein